MGVRGRFRGSGTNTQTLVGLIVRGRQDDPERLGELGVAIRRRANRRSEDVQINRSPRRVTNPRQLHEGGVAGLPQCRCRAWHRQTSHQEAADEDCRECSTHYLLLPLGNRILSPAVSDLQVERAGPPERENSRT